MINERTDKLFRLIRRCQRDRETPGRETFTVRIRGGTARVVCNNLYKVYVEATFDDGRVKKWIRQTMTAAELLDRLGACEESPASPHPGPSDPPSPQGEGII